MSDTQTLDEILAHHGVMGMKWGVRKARSTGPVEVTSTAKPGKPIKTKGGANHPASPDALKTARTRQVAKASSTDALSTKELQDLVQRMNLEQQYVRLSANRQKTLGQKFIGHLLGIATSEVNQASKGQAGPLVGLALKNNAAKQKAAKQKASAGSSKAGSAPSGTTVVRSHVV